MNLIKDRAIRSLYSNIVTITSDNNGVVTCVDENNSSVIINDADVTAKVAELEIRDGIQAEIDRLEATVSPRRMREAVAGGAGADWLAAVETAIATERAKL